MGATPSSPLACTQQMLGGATSSDYNQLINEVCHRIALSGLRISTTGAWTLNGSSLSALGYFNVKDYGALGDGATNDAAAVTAAITACSAAGGGVVFFPDGVFVVASQLTFPDRVRGVGSSAASGASRILASSGFPINTPIIRLGSTGHIFGVRLEHLFIDCNNVSGSSGVQMNEAGERCGLFDVVIQAVGSGKGVDISGGAGAIVEIDNLELYGAFTTGIEYNQEDGLLRLNHVTIIPGAGTDGIKMTAGCLDASSIHIEACVDGIDFASSSGGIVSGITGNNLVTNLIHITASNRGVVALGVFPNGATNAVKDDILTRTIVSASDLSVSGGLPLYVLGARSDTDGTANRTVIPMLPNASGAKAGWVMPKLSGVAGSLNLPLTASVNINREMTGSLALTDGGVAVAADMFTLTLSAVAGEDDCLSAICEYSLRTLTGGTKSIETGQVSFAITQDSSGNIVVGVPVKYGTVQALDAGMATLVVTFTTNLVGTVLTVRCTSETSANVSSNIHFTVRVTGGNRATSACALAVGVTVAA